MTPLNVNLRHLIEQVDIDLPDAPILTKIAEAQQRARSLNDIGDQLVDHFVTQARTTATPWSHIGEALGVSKQAAQQRWVPPIFQRFTDRARHVIVLAQEEARTLKHEVIDDQHILLGVVAETSGMAAQILTERGASATAVRAALGAALTPGTSNPPARLPFTGEGKAVLDEAGNAAISLGHDFIGTEHILLGLFRVTDGPSAAALASLNISENDMRAEIARRVEAIEPSATDH
jgi:hypothetical protein